MDEKEKEEAKKKKEGKKKEEGNDKEHLQGDYRTLIDRFLDPKVMRLISRLYNVYYLIALLSGRESNACVELKVGISSTAMSAYYECHWSHVK